jgi:hypothetical protein
MTNDRDKSGFDERDPDRQIEDMLRSLDTEKAPESLTRRLYRIPSEERRRQERWSWRNWLRPVPQWAPALAAIPLLVIAVFLLREPQPSPADVEQARHDLAVAFAYLDKVGSRTGNEIQSVLGSELRHCVKEPLSEHLPFTESSRKEETT